MIKSNETTKVTEYQLGKISLELACTVLDIELWNPELLENHHVKKVAKIAREVREAFYDYCAPRASLNNAKEAK